MSGRLPRWARDLADTDDLVQDTLLRTFTKIEDFEPWCGRAPGILRQAVLNRVRDELRRKGRAPERMDGDELELEAAEGSPLEEAIGREAVERYQAALARLRPSDREVVIGRVEMDYTYPELAEVLGKPSEAARKAAGVRCCVWRRK